MAGADIGIPSFVRDWRSECVVSISSGCGRTSEVAAGTFVWNALVGDMLGLGLFVVMVASDCFSVVSNTGSVGDCARGLYSIVVGFVAELAVCTGTWWIIHVVANACDSRCS